MLLKKFIYFIFSLFLLFSPCFALPRSSFLSNEEGKPSLALLDILDYFCIEHDGSWSSIKEETQKKWMQTPHVERWQFHTQRDPDPICTYFLFSQLGMTQAVFPKSKKYDYAVILGSTVNSVRMRFWFLKRLWDRGLRFKKIIVLTGDRPLDHTLENKRELLDPDSTPFSFRSGWHFNGILPHNETEMTKLVFDQLALPPSWRKMEVIFVDAKKPKDRNRPATEDTFKSWLELHPKPGKILIVSQQPFLERQDAVARKWLPSSFDIETIGKGFSYQDMVKKKQGLTILLDELAKWIYEEEGVKDCSFNKLPCL